ncbi:MAG: hypothetical protein ACI854_000261 [Arenicella sp.]|jgi:hypothetical protein
MNISISIRKAIPLVMVCLYLSDAHATSANDAQKKQSSSKVYFTVGDQHEFPLTEEKSNFDCSEKIFTVIELSNFAKAKYHLAIVWLDPSGTERERTEYPFTVVVDETRLWSWLSLSRAQGAAMIQWIDPAAGLEEFIGPWTVDVRINNQKIKTKKFEVLC